MATSTDTFAQKYAKSFLAALDGQTNESLVKIKEELDSLQIFADEPILSFFLNPVFHADEKTKVLDDFFSKNKFHEETKQFVYTLLTLNQIQLMEGIAKYFTEVLNDKNRETKIQVSSAFTLSKEEEDKIKASFENTFKRKVLLDVTVDPNLIGGIRAQVGGVVYDSSIEGHLARLQKEFTI